LNRRTSSARARAGKIGQGRRLQEVEIGVANRFPGLMDDARALFGASLSSAHQARRLGADAIENLDNVDQSDLFGRLL
jgi:hypothetical protein